MPAHKFQVGEIVHVSPSRDVPGGSYQVIKQLPEINGQFQYRIKSVKEPHERVVREASCANHNSKRPACGQLHGNIRPHNTLRVCHVSGIESPESVLASEMNTSIANQLAKRDSVHNLP